MEPSDVVIAVFPDYPAAEAAIAALTAGGVPKQALSVAGKSVSGGKNRVTITATSFPVMLRGTPDDMARAKAILGGFASAGAEPPVSANAAEPPDILSRRVSEWSHRARREIETRGQLRRA